jgi:nitrate/nitrite transporter NarK
VLKEEYGLSIFATSGSMSLLNIAGIISNPLGSIIDDKVGEKKVLLYGFFFLMVPLYYSLWAMDLLFYFPWYF